MRDDTERKKHSPELKPATEEISGLIGRVTFHNSENGFCVLRVKTPEHQDETTVIGVGWRTGFGSASTTYLRPIKQADKARFVQKREISLRKPADDLAVLSFGESLECFCGHIP